MKTHLVKCRRILWIIPLSAICLVVVVANFQVKAFVFELVQTTDSIPIPPTPGIFIPISIEDFRTVSPLNISNTTNLAIGYDDQDLMLYIIKRADGSYEEWFIPIEYGEGMKANMKLEAGDVIVVSAPLVPLRSTPMLDKHLSEQPEIQSTAIPYPAPLLETSTIPNPYPYP